MKEQWLSVMKRCWKRRWCGHSRSALSWRPRAVKTVAGAGRSGRKSTGSEEQEWATAMGALFGAGEMEEEDGEGAGAAEEQEEVDSGDEGSSQGGEDEDGTPSWVLGGFESAEAEQKHLEWEKKRD
mmetsp:Transcript_125222/g.286944  ORF Transcript_125222/g.286944 Transcript_125222/m.286944 type:complete len:126 (+) Transcript_125222:16-393(+)